MQKPREKVIRLPIIYDAGGDINKKWFIEFYAKNPRTKKLERQRIYKGINKFHSIKARRAAAEKEKKYWTEKLKAGWNPFINSNVIYDDNLQYQTFIKNYKTSKSRNGTFKYYASKYLDHIANGVEETTISTYRSKLRLFNEWLDGKDLSDADVSVITHELMVKFFFFIIEERELSKVSVDNYRILLSAVFEYLRKERKQFPNPCIELPGTKRVNDSSADPIYEDDIPIFKEAILRNDPQLWLAICFEYYCFLRPRKEIRFMKIGDIDFGRGMIRVREKLGKTGGRWVNIPKQFMQLMREKYKLHTYPRDFFVIGKKGEPGTDHVSINNLSERFVRFRRKLEMPESYKLYSWKHTGNIRADNAGIPTREIQFQDGHTTIATTERYMRKRKAVPAPNIINNFPDI